MNDSIRASGQVKITIKDADGNVKEKDVSNQIVTSGLNLLAQRIGGATGAITTIALGDDGDIPITAADTALHGELGSTGCTTTVTNNKIKYETTFDPGWATGTISEAGLFNGASGVMCSRVVFDAIEKAAGDTLTINWILAVN